MSFEVVSLASVPCHIRHLSCLIKDQRVALDIHNCSSPDLVLGYLDSVLEFRLSATP